MLCFTLEHDAHTKPFRLMFEFSFEILFQNTFISIFTDLNSHSFWHIHYVISLSFEFRRIFNIFDNFDNFNNFNNFNNSYHLCSTGNVHLKICVIFSLCLLIIWNVSLCNRHQQNASYRLHHQLCKIWTIFHKFALISQ